MWQGAAVPIPPGVARAGVCRLQRGSRGAMGCPIGWPPEQRVAPEGGLKCAHRDARDEWLGGVRLTSGSVTPGPRLSGTRMFFTVHELPPMYFTGLTDRLRVRRSDRGALKKPCGCTRACTDWWVRLGP